MWDVRDLANPVLKSRYVSSQTAVDHNQYVLGGFTYQVFMRHSVLWMSDWCSCKYVSFCPQANYEAGLRILKIDAHNGRYDLQEVAYFDLFPSRTRAEFNGAWSVYPYYASGKTTLLLCIIWFSDTFTVLHNGLQVASNGHRTSCSFTHGWIFERYIHYRGWLPKHSKSLCLLSP